MTRLARLRLTAAVALASIALRPAPAPRRVRTPTAVSLKRLGGEPCPDDSEFICAVPTVPPNPVWP